MNTGPNMILSFTDDYRIPTLTQSVIRHDRCASVSSGIAGQLTSVERTDTHLAPGEKLREAMTRRHAEKYSEPPTITQLNLFLLIAEIVK
jgi:hypothetical protein